VFNLSRQLTLADCDTWSCAFHSNKGTRFEIGLETASTF